MSDTQRPSILGTPAWIRVRPEDLENGYAVVRSTDKSDLLGDIDLRDLQAAVEVDDDAMVLVVSDGDSTVLFQPGVATSPTEAVAGARALAAAAAHYADLLAVRLGEDLPDSYLSSQADGPC